jgi:hypothetical protein
MKDLNKVAIKVIKHNKKVVPAIPLVGYGS